MLSPFPEMDPYIETPELWSDFFRRRREQMLPCRTRRMWRSRLSRQFLDDLFPEALKIL